MRRSALVPLTMAVALVAIAGCAQATQEPVNDMATVLGDDVVAPLIDELTAGDVSRLGAGRLADGLAPPTNRWFSGLVFGDAPLPVFPLPLSFALTGGGFTFGVPVVTTTADTIAGGNNPAVFVDAGAASTRIVAYDDASVTIALLDASDATIGTVVIASGSPLVSFTAATDFELATDQQFTAAGDAYVATVGEREYGLVTDAEISTTASGAAIGLSDGDTAVFVAVPDGAPLSDIVPAARAVTGVSLAYSVGDGAATTTLRYNAGGDTLIAAMPHQVAGGAGDCTLGSYPSVYGELALCAGTDLSFTAPAMSASSSLDLSALSDEARAELGAQVAIDAATEVELPADTYFGGKALYRLANLLDLADQLGDRASRDLLSARLGDALAEWTDPAGCADRDERCFVYDESAKGVIGLAASFGSDEFNDHHFHYGYFLYAASVAARLDPSLVDELSPVITLLAADIASSGSSFFPDRRTFDAYASHSWASGPSPFADGNNQESSSEAVTAYNGLALWAAAIGDDDLAQQAEWMLSAETASAAAYWTDFDREDAVYDGFTHSITSLNWGGKRDYSTWFSAEPSAKLGILLLPMSPVAADGALGTDADRVRENLAQGAPAGYDVMFGDYLLMYLSLAEPAEALTLARALPEARIDDGNSRAYMLAFILSRQ